MKTEKKNFTSCCKENHGQLFIPYTVLKFIIISCGILISFTRNTMNLSCILNLYYKLASLLIYNLNFEFS